MSRSRWSIATLMASVAALAIGLGALRTGSFAWFRALYAATLATLLLSVVLARYRPGTGGAFWFGFAVFGWGYFLIGIGPWTEWGRVGISGQGEFLQPRANPLLPTDGGVRWLADRLFGHLRPPLAGQNVTVSAEVFRAHTKAMAGYKGRLESAIGTGHLVVVWVWGAIGGLVARVVVGRHPPNAPQADA